MNKEISDLRKEIKLYLINADRTLASVVDEMNKRHPDKLTTPQNINNKIARGTLKYEEAKEIADIIGYKIKWIKKDD
ncbi:LLM class flavin-dependent oxidoreductase [Clostridioides difficile]|uniref:LLM class flavin-dependent oxidoreductase n=1 Tax=Clostridioides difficile TaxID=1496 RepID=UPI001F2D2360|nr:LLM class flavin-dependent oxidoreductase [Clostridioides difficile]